MSVDRSHLDRKYFIDNKVYNCPFCNRRNVRYSINTYNRFNWSSERICNVWMVKCSDCRMISMHLTFEDIGVQALPIEFGRIHTPDDEINAHWSWDAVEDNIVLYKAISDYFLSHPDGITVTDSALFQN